jgi:hypothetical protein
MNKQAVKKTIYRSAGIISILGLGVMLAPQKAQALFGIPDLVIDLIQEANSMKQVIQEIQMVASLQQQYEHLKAQAMQFKQKGTWLTIGKQVANVSTANTAGETIPWDSLTRGNPADARQAWSAATVAVQPNQLLRNESVGSSAILAHLASVETIDRASVQCLATISQYRADTARNRSAYTSLENAQLDGSDGTNSEIQQLNLINAANAQAANERRSQGNIQACLAEQQTLANKIQRDALTQNLNTLTEMQRGLANSPAPGNMAEAIKNY